MYPKKYSYRSAAYCGCVLVLGLLFGCDDKDGTVTQQATLKNVQPIEKITESYEAKAKELPVEVEEGTITHGMPASLSEHSSNTNQIQDEMLEQNSGMEDVKATEEELTRQRIKIANGEVALERVSAPLNTYHTPSSWTVVKPINQ